MPQQTLSDARGRLLDSFSYFIVFFSLILGLALTELLGGFARLVRARALRKLEPQTALVALVTLILLCATWLDAWDTLKSIRLDFGDLWAPVLMVICFYLAAAVIFPHDEADHERLADYYRERRAFIMTMLFAAALLENFTTRGLLVAAWERNPPSFWIWYMPLNLAIDGSLLALIFVRSRTANLVLLVLLILLITIPYWSNGGLGRVITHAFGY